MRTFVFAATQDMARTWCGRNGVKPYSRDTIIVTTPEAIVGFRREPEDEIVMIELGHNPRYPEIRRAAAPAGILL